MSPKFQQFLTQLGITISGFGAAVAAAASENSMGGETITIIEWTTILAPTISSLINSWVSSPKDVRNSEYTRRTDPKELD